MGDAPLGLRARSEIARVETVRRPDRPLAALADVRRAPLPRRRALEKSGQRALLLPSTSISHRHFTTEAEIPEDMSHEHVYHHGQYLWDMRVLDLMRRGKSRELIDELPDFIDQTESEVKAGSLTWLIAALGFPEYPAGGDGDGAGIGTGNPGVEWDPAAADKAMMAK